MRRSSLLLALSLALASASACHSNKQSPAIAANPAVDASAATAQTTAAVDDHRLAAAIRARLAEDPSLRDHPLEVDVTQGSVALAGVVPSLLSRARALEVARSFKGARELVSHISVAPGVVPDEQLRQSTVAALAGDPLTRTAKLNVTVLDGVVTLKGTVDSQGQRALLAEVIERVAGARQIDDDVTVPLAVERPERDIAAEVRETLDDDALLEGAKVSADVKKRDVYLTGMVGSLAQREQALHDARVPGVDEVDAHGLRVEWEESERARQARPSAPVSDAHITDAVRRALARDPLVGARAPSVAVSGGTVTLGGTLDGLRAARAAARDAGRVRGVESVADHMAVIPADRAPDATVEDRVQQTLFNDPSVASSHSLQVTTRNGRVALTGNVRSIEEKRIIERDLETVPGVVAVEDDLRISSGGSPLSASAVEDLLTRAKERIFWDPRVDTGHVSVTVSTTGAVTLTGTVATPEQVKAAREDAVEAGAASVVAQLHVNAEG